MIQRGWVDLHDTMMIWDRTRRDGWHCFWWAVLFIEAIASRRAAMGMIWVMIKNKICIFSWMVYYKLPRVVFSDADSYIACRSMIAASYMASVASFASNQERWMV